MENVPALEVENQGLYERNFQNTFTFYANRSRHTNNRQGSCSFGHLAYGWPNGYESCLFFCRMD